MKTNTELQTRKGRITLWIVLVFKSHLDLRKSGQRLCHQALCPTSVASGPGRQPPASLLIGFVFVSLGTSAHFIRDRGGQMLAPEHALTCVFVLFLIDFNLQIYPPEMSSGLCLKEILY